MATETLPNFILQFIEDHIETVEQLEILLLLGCHPGDLFTLDKVYEIILSSRLSVERGLAYFTSKGLIEHEESRYRFDANNSELAPIISKLAAAYRLTPIRVIEAIYSRKRS